MKPSGEFYTNGIFLDFAVERVQGSTRIETVFIFKSPTPRCELWFLPKIGCSYIAIVGYNTITIFPLESSDEFSRVAIDQRGVMNKFWKMRGRNFVTEREWERFMIPVSG